MKSTRTDLVRRDENVEPPEHQMRAPKRADEKMRRRRNRDELHERLKALKEERMQEGFVAQHERRSRDDGGREL